MRALARDESGQILPLLLVMTVLLIGAGFLVLWLGASTVITSKAQTAADAAALAGEQELVNEMQQVRYGPDGQVLAPTFDKATVCNQAAKYAANNYGYMSCPRDIQFLPSSAGLFGTDVEVTVHSQQTLPNGAPGGGHGATTTARASTDPFSQASPDVTTTTTSCDASVVDGAPYDPPTAGTGPGFFAQKNTDYTHGCEPKLAGKLQALANAKRLHLVGVRGYDSSSSATGAGGAGSAAANGTAGVGSALGTAGVGAAIDAGGAGSGAGGAAGAGSALGAGSSATATSSGSGSTVTDEIDAAHSCGAASTTEGLPKPGAPNQITDATLSAYGLRRPFPSMPDEIELVGGGGCTQEVSSTAGASQTVGFGNADVHLVPITGGPVGSFATLPFSSGPITVTAQGLALGCQIWSIGNSLRVNPTIMLSAFLAGYDESTMRNITSYDGQGYSLGMLQQQAPDGWGTPAQEIIPADAIRMYFGGTGPGTGFYDGSNADAGAIQDWRPGISPWALAQTVQGSQPGNNAGALYGSNYEGYLGPANTMINDIKGGACKPH